MQIAIFSMPKHVDLSGSTAARPRFSRVQHVSEAVLHVYVAFKDRAVAAAGRALDNFTKDTGASNTFQCEQ